jgi:hypothetical protein
VVVGFTLARHRAVSDMDRKSHGSARQATAPESEQSVLRWLGQPSNSVEGSIAALWQRAVASMTNRLSISP